MAYIWWKWDTNGIEELVVDFTIHNDVELRGRNGLYLMLVNGYLSDVDFYFGLQTDVHSPQRPSNRGKGLIFSRWGERDLSNARVAEADGWTESSAHEGDFIGVRRSYEWGAGDYRARFAPDDSGPPETGGRWFGVWVTNLETNVTTWAGSLKFPLKDGKALIRPSVYSTIEIYGGTIRPIDIPQWHVSMKRPLGDGKVSLWGMTGYTPLEVPVPNSDIRYDRQAGEVHFRAGGTTERETPPSERVDFE